MSQIPVTRYFGSTNCYVCRYAVNQIIVAGKHAFLSPCFPHKCHTRVGHFYTHSILYVVLAQSCPKYLLLVPKSSYNIVTYLQQLISVEIKQQYRRYTSTKLSNRLHGLIAEAFAHMNIIGIHGNIYKCYDISHVQAPWKASDIICVLSCHSTCIALRMRCYDSEILHIIF